MLLYFVEKLGILARARVSMWISSVWSVNTRWNIAQFSKVLQIAVLLQYLRETANNKRLFVSSCFTIHM